MSNEQNKSIVRRYLEDVWGRGESAALRDLVSQDVLDHDPWPGQPCGFEGQQFAVSSFLSAVSNYKLTIDNLVAEGDRAYDHWTATATHTGTFAGLAPTGRTFTMTGTDEYRIAGGKIAEIWHCEDMLGVLRQLGYAPPAQLPQSYGTRSTTRPSPTGSGSRLSDSDRRARVREAFQAFIDRGDLGSVGSYLAPDYAGHFSAFPPVYGFDGFREFLSLYTTALSNRHTDIEDIVLDGDYGGVRVVYHGKNTGSMFGMPATGKSVAVKALVTFRFAGDLVAEQWANNDDLGMMQQLGVIPAMAAAAEPC